MPQQKVVVPLLNVRTAPVEDTGDKRNVTGQVNSTFGFESVEQLTNSAGIWYKDKDGNWYWGGGLSGFSAPTAIQQLFNYNDLVANIPDVWRVTKGEGISVAILDTGCFNHDYLKDLIIARYNAIDKSVEINDTSDSSHGTFIAGLLAANNNNEIIGIASSVKLIIIKVAENDVSVDSDNVLEGLNWLHNVCPVKPDIINLSLDIDPFPNENKFQAILSQLSNSAIIFAAAQNDSSLIGDNIFYPATEACTIAVGALDSNSGILKNEDYKKINKRVKYIVPNINFQSTNKANQFSFNRGCSFSTAVMTGVAALALSFQRSQNSAENLITTIDSSALNINPAIFNNDLNFFKNS